MKKKPLPRRATEEAVAAPATNGVAERLLKAPANGRSSVPTAAAAQRRNPNDEVDRESIRAALAAVLGVPKSKVTNAVMTKHVRRIQHDARADATFVGLYLNQQTVHLTEIGCIRPADIKQYFEAEQRVLRDLYTEIGRPHPSPTKLVQLSVQYALDARKTISAPIHRIDIRPIKAGYEIAVLSLGQTKIPSLPCPGQAIGNPFANLLLALVQRKPPAYSELMEWIETLSPVVISSPHDSVQPKSAASLLVVDLEDSIVLIAGRPYPVSDEGARLVMLLNSEPNVWFGPKDYKQDEVLKLSRVPRVYEKLPSPIKALIEGKSGSGYRLAKSRLAQLSQKMSVVKPGESVDNRR